MELDKLLILCIEEKKSLKKQQYSGFNIDLIKMDTIFMNSGKK